MHRFYMVHSFKAFHRVNVSTAALFLAAKVEEQPKRLESMAKVFHSLHNREGSDLDVGSPEYTKIIEDITYHELLLLETLGFEVQVEHPHQHVVMCTRLVRASKDLSQTAYFMAHNSLLLTTFCLEHRPTVVACVCIHLAATWKGEDFTNLSSQRSNWWEYVDPSVTLEQLNELTKEFLTIYERCPSRLQKKITEPMKSQHYKHKPGSSSSSSSSTSSSSSHHHLPHPAFSLSQSSSNQPDQSKPTVKHKLLHHPARDQGQSSSSQGRTHSLHAHGQLQPHGGGKQPPSSSKGAPQQVPQGHKPHHPHNHPPHPHQSKSSMAMAGTSSSQLQQHLPHAKLAVSASMSATKSHHAHHADGKHHMMPGMSSGATSKHPHQLQSGIHGAKSGNELANALGGGSGHLAPPHMKHQRPPQGGGMHGNPNSDPSKYRHHHKLHARVLDPHLNHSYDLQKGVKRPHSEENLDRKRLKLDPSLGLGLPMLPPLPPLPADPPPPPPPTSVSSMSRTGVGVSTNNATLPPLPLMGIETPALPPLPPPLPLSNPDESPPPPPPPPNH